MIRSNFDHIHCRDLYLAAGPSRRIGLKSPSSYGLSAISELLVNVDNENLFSFRPTDIDYVVLAFFYFLAFVPGASNKLGESLSE